MLRKLGFLAIAFSILYPSLGIDKGTFAASGSFILFPVAVIAVFIPDARRWLKYVAALLMITLSLVAALVSIPPALVGGVLAFMTLRSARQQEPDNEPVYAPEPVAQTVVIQRVPPPPPGMFNAAAVGEDTKPYRPVQMTAKRRPAKKGQAQQQLAAVIVFGAILICGMWGYQSVGKVLPSTRLSDRDRIATANASGDSVSATFLDIDGVLSVGTSSARSDDFYAEIVVRQGYVTLETAERLRPIVSSMTGNTKFMSFILDDGVLAIAFTWRGEREGFNQVVLHPVR